MKMCLTFCDDDWKYILNAILLGAHTNHIENAWGKAKRFIKGKSIKSDAELQQWLIIYMWRKWKADKWPGGPFTCFLNNIREKYNMV